MVRSGNSLPGDRPIERARTTFDQGVRAVKTWWRARETPKQPASTVPLATDAHVPSASSLSNGTGDAVVAQVSAELERFRRDVDGHDIELLHALERLAGSYERVVVQLESDRRERRMLAEAVLRLERRLSAAELSTGERVTGGWVGPETEPLPPDEPADEMLQSSAPEREEELDRINELFGHPVSERS